MTASLVRCSSAALSLALAALALPAVAQDADGDSVPDAADARPCDATIAGIAYAPAEGQHGVVLLEDHWPAHQSDVDFNDAVVTYNYIYWLDGQGRVTRVQATLTPLAAGGSFRMGLGLHLPVARAAVQSVTLSTGGAAPVALTPSINDAELTVTLVDDLATLFAGAVRPVNSQAGTTRVAGQPLSIDVRFTNPPALFTASAPHDLYIFHTETPSHEIHLPAYPGTAAMDTSLFGTARDGSSNGRWFLDVNKLPSAILLPLGTAYPREFVSIAELFPRVANWAVSGGDEDADFYVGDTVAASAYSDVNGNGPFSPASPPGTGTGDDSCVAVDRPITSNVTINDANVASYAGTRWSVSSGVTVTIATSAPISIHSLSLAGTIVPAACTTSACYGVDLRVTADATIHSTGLIHADARGYLGNLQSGNGTIGRTYGNVPSGAAYFTGGSHGGYGGRTSGDVAAVYDDFLHPVFPGGGGTSLNTTNPSYMGGNGGGVVRLEAGGTLTINGRVRANGGRGGGYDSGGAGGSVWLRGAQVTTSAAANTVLVEAVGAYGYYSGGGGGRVAVYGTPAGNFNVQTMVRAHGGNGGNYGSGGAGTVAFGVDQPGAQSLFLSAGSGALNSNYADTPVGAFGAITVVNATTLTTSAWLQAGSLAGRTLIADVEGSQTFTIASNTSNTITISGSGLDDATAVGRSFCVADYLLASLTVAGRTDADLGCVVVVGNLQVQDSATVDLFRATAGNLFLRDTAQVTAYDVGATAAELRETSRLTVRNFTGVSGALFDSALVTGWAATTSRVYPLTLTFGSLSMTTASRVTVDGLGYLGSLRSGNGTIGRTNGNVASGAAYFSGGSHGGYGGITSGAPQMLFDDVYQPHAPGGGGTSLNTTNASYAGGNGGGVLRVDVSGTFTLDGRITANGSRGGGYDSGGAGGSIWVTAGNITRNTTGLAVQASGSYGYYSGGGGGRVALHYGDLGGSWTIDASSVQAYGGTAGNYGPGGSGTVLYRRTSEANGRLLLSAPTGVVSNYARTRLGAFGAVTVLSGNVLTTSAPLEANTLVGRRVRPDVEQAAVFTIASNTANTITVVESGLTSASAVGRTFAVTDYAADFDEIIVEGVMSVDAGRLAATGGLTVRGSALLDFSELDATTLSLNDSVRLYGRAVEADGMTMASTARLTVQDVNAGVLAMTGASVITGWAPTTTRVYPVSINAGTMSMTSATLVQTDALGYLGSIASGATTGRTNGNVLSGAAYFSGGAHGGFGGITSGTPAWSYGNALRPVSPGGGGTSQNTTNATYAGGNGGGVIRIVVADGFQLDGRVSANGGRGGGYDSGGAGGSVWIDAGTLSRTVTSGYAVEANGSYGYYSGGGGGRVAIYYGAIVGWAIGATNVRASGGTAGNYGPGGAGTVVYAPVTQARPNLLMTSSSGVNSNYSPTRLGTYGTVSSVSGAVLQVSTVLEAGALVGRTLVVDAENENLTFTVVSNTASSITADSTLTGLTASGASWYIQDDQVRFANVLIQGDARVAAGYVDADNTAVLEGTADWTLVNADLTDLTVRGSARLQARRISDAVVRFQNTTVTTLRAIVAATMSMENTAVVTGYGSTLTATYPITVVVDELTIASGARLHTDALGYLGSLQGGNGVRGRTSGNVASTADFFSGGSHGGRGGAQGATNAAPVYDSSAQPVLPGGGGTSHNTTNASYAGGNGGGVIRIRVTNRFTHDGVVAANGARGAGYDSGGAGGSIWVTAGTLASNNGTGRFEANGSYGYYSGGGGGCVAVEASATQGWTSSATTLRATGGTAGNYGAGAAGTTVFTGI